MAIRIILAALLAITASAQVVDYSYEPASGGGGSGTISNGASNDIPCYTDTNTIGPCDTGAFIFNSTLLWAGFDPNVIFMVDEFGCTDQDNQYIGNLGWSEYTGILTTACQSGTTPSVFTVKTGAADSLRGIVAFRSGAGTFTTPVVGSIEDDTEFIAYARFLTVDTSQVVYKIGFMNDAATETVEHDAATVSQDFIGVYWKNETVDGADECGGLSTAAGGYTDNTGWQFYSSDDATTSGLVDSTEAVSAANYTWVRWRYTSTPGVEVCIDVASGAPTFANCNEFTTLSQISGGSMGFGFLVSTCDGSNAGNNGRLDVDYWALKHSRY